MKTKATPKKWFRSLMLISACFALTMVLEVSGSFTLFENKTYDQRMIYSAKKLKASDEIYFIGVNQESIYWANKNYGWSWPWPREAWANMVDFFNAGKPKAIAFDIIFTEDSIYGPADDLKFAQAEAESQKVIQTVFISHQNDQESVLYPIPEIKNNAAIIGNITSLNDSDGIIRKGRLSYTSSDGETFPTLGTAPLFLENPDSAADSLKNLPLNKDGSVLLRYCSSIDSYQPYWAKDIFESYDAWKNGEEGTYSPSDFEDAYIYIAYYAPGLFDICSTPVSQVYPGVGVHITTLDNYLNNNFIHTTPLYIFVLWILFLAVFANLIVSISAKTPQQNISVSILIAGFITGILVTVLLPYSLFSRNIWFKMVAPLFCFLLTYLSSVALSLTVEGKQKRFIKTAFSQCLSKDVVNQILSNPDSFTLGGRNFQMSAIFTDIQKFSSFSELLTAAQLGKLLNYYLTRMSEIIIEEKGTVDKYEGDAIIAMVGAPMEMKDHAVHACAAAVKMKKAEIEMNKEILEIAANPLPEKMDPELYQAFQILVSNHKTIFTRIGINSGEMIAGYFGSDNKKNYTMMGNNVNLSSRLEGVNKQYHTNGILISEATYKLLDNEFICRSLDRVRVVNINTPIRLYEVMDFSSNSKLKEYTVQWENAMADFEQKNYKAALEQLQKLSARNPEDNVAKYYINLLEKYFINGKYPAEADGEGVAYIPEDNVFNLLQK